MSDMVQFGKQPCWECERACGDCEWSANLMPVEGWKAHKVRVHRNGTRLSYTTYAIDYCPKFKRDAIMCGMVSIKKATPKDESQLEEWIAEGAVQPEQRSKYLLRIEKDRERKREQNRINSQNKRERKREIERARFEADFRREIEAKYGKHEQSHAEKATDGTGARFLPEEQE